MDWQQWLIVAIIAVVVVGIYIRHRNVTRYEAQVREQLRKIGCPYYNDKAVFESYDNGDSALIAAHRLKRIWEKIDVTRKFNQTGKYACPPKRMR